MSAIEFVVRDGAGAVTRGSVAGGGGDNAIALGAGQEVSLNLDRSNILSYVRQGQSLQVTLVDGETISIQGFFGADGAAVGKLFISANGALSVVDLTVGEGDLLYAQYVDSEAFGKWSPDDDLYFVRGSEVVVAGVEATEAEAGMLFTPLLGGIGGLSALGAGAAAVGAAAVIGGTVGGKDTGKPADPTDTTSPTAPTDTTNPTDPTDPANPTDPTNPTDPIDPTTPLAVVITGGTKGAGVIVNSADHADGVEISGTGTPNASGTITVGGVTKDITVDGNGNWITTFAPQEIEGGEYQADVSVTLVSGGQTATATDAVVIDTVAAVSVNADAVETDGTVNFAEEANGITLTGTTQAGSTVVVHVDGTDYTADVTDETWTVDLPAGTIAQGEYDLNVSVTATDEHGNTASAQNVVHIDTVNTLTLDTSGTGNDGTINRVEHADGATIVGVAEANASVVVTMGNYSHTVNADANGNWSATFTAAQTPTGTLDMPVTALSTDAAGNTATASGTIHIDTVIDVTVNTGAVAGDGTVNFVEHANGIRLTGTSTGADTVSVNFGGVTHTATVAADGTWYADYAHGEFASGEINVPVTVSATDAAGNSDTASSTINVDTFVNRLANAAGRVEGDDIVNAAEAADGITLNGVVEHGASVLVTFEGTTRTATVDGNGNWSAHFNAAEIPSGEYATTVQIDATDRAGNTASITDSFMVDTIAPNAADIESVTYADTSTRGFSMLNVGTGVAVDVTEFTNGADDAATPVQGGSFTNPINGELQHIFSRGAEVPDGSHIVVTTSDAAGNNNSTLLVLDDDTTSIVDMSAAAIGDFNIGAIDLEYAQGSQLSLSTADLERLSANGNTLIVHGGTDDAVTLNGTATAVGTKTINNQDYDVYSVGSDGGALIINQDIDFNQSVI